MPLKKVFFLLLFLIAPLLIAQSENSVNEKEKVNSLESGSWSLQFQITDNFQLKSFSGQTISVKYHFTESSAIRTGLTLNTRSADYETSYPDLVEENNSDKSENDRSEISLNTDYLFYLAPENNLNFFFGGGLEFNFSKTKSSDSRREIYSDTTYSIRTESRDNKSHGYGVRLLVGVEWFVNSYISFHAEYSTKITYELIDYKRIAETNYIDPSREGIVRKENSEGDTINIYPYSVQFGLSVYF